MLIRSIRLSSHSRSAMIRYGGEVLVISLLFSHAHGEWYQNHYMTEPSRYSSETFLDTSSQYFAILFAQYLPVHPTNLSIGLLQSWVSRTGLVCSLSQVTFLISIKFRDQKSDQILSHSTLHEIPYHEPKQNSSVYLIFDWFRNKGQACLLTSIFYTIVEGWVVC